MLHARRRGESRAVPSIAVIKAVALSLQVFAPMIPVQNRLSSSVRIRRRFRIVFLPLQNARHHVVADEFSDRRWSARYDPAGDTICLARPQARGCVARTSGDMRVFAAWKL